MIIDGGCHCGSLTVRFETPRAAEQLNPVRCPCAFCSGHGAVYVADASGHASITIANTSPVLRYRFATGCTEYMLCGQCGILVAALIVADDGALVSALNMNITGQPMPAQAEDTAWSAQSANERVAYRRARWTPTRIVD